MSIQMKSRKRQSGAVLYVALIMLVLLALIGIVALQVAGLQERMSSNYQSANLAFQRTEEAARTQEADITTKVDTGVLPPTNLPATDCDTIFDPESWTNTTNQHVRRVDLCFSWGGMDVGTMPEEERTDQIYQITAFRRDRALFPSSEALIATVFIP
jgi:type IV pilus assembly protein PilX